MVEALQDKHRKLVQVISSMEKLEWVKLKIKLKVVDLVGVGGLG